jgi:hypothetical protein
LEPALACMLALKSSANSLHYIVASYAMQAPAPALPPTLPDALMDRLRTLGPHIAVDVALMARLSRVLRFVLSHSLAAAAADANSAAAATVAQVGACL